LSEELIFRAPCSALSPPAPPAVAVALSSLLFGIWHILPATTPTPRTVDRSRTTLSALRPLRPCWRPSRDRAGWAWRGCGCGQAAFSRQPSHGGQHRGVRRGRAQIPSWAMSGARRASLEVHARCRTLRDSRQGQVERILRRRPTGHRRAVETIPRARWKIRPRSTGAPTRPGSRPGTRGAATSRRHA
jgi:hypothetical protein